MAIPAGKPSSTDETYIIGQWISSQGRDEPSPVKEETLFTAGQITLKKRTLKIKRARSHCRYQSHN
jgi:hypothetical protein